MDRAKKRVYLRHKEPKVHFSRVLIHPKDAKEAVEVIKENDIAKSHFCSLAIVHFVRAIKTASPEEREELLDLNILRRWERDY